MSGSDSWFYVWVPARNWERESHSKPRFPEEGGRRVFHQCSRELEAPAPPALNESYPPPTVETPPRPFRFNEDRPVLRSLPAIQEDHDPSLQRSAVPSSSSSSSKDSLRFEVLSGLSSNPESPVNSSQQDESRRPQLLVGNPTKGLESAGSDRKSPSYTVTIVPEDNLSSTTATEAPAVTASVVPATAPIPLASAESGGSECDSVGALSSSESNSSRIKDSSNNNCDKEDRLLKQESYDSHERRGQGDQFTPLTPSNPLLHDEREPEVTPFVDWEPLEDVCCKLLQRLNISPVCIQPSADKKQVLFTFCVPFNLVEQVLIEFQNQGIGLTGETTVSVVPSSIHYSTQRSPLLHRRHSQDDKMDRFYSSVKSRLLVAEVIARIQAGAEFSFDYVLLLVLAGAIAFMGLVENSSVILVASMLVSPLMGPILAGIFGGVVQDYSLAWKGIRHETSSLFICILLGFVFGLLISPFPKQYGCTQWPTSEMLSRGETRALWVGILIAVPSGAGVALSVLGGNAGSLVGVAISASLLPPAVNAGLFWALSLVLTLSDSRPESFYGFGESGSNETSSLYRPRYSPDLGLESFLLGLTSLAITLINILCIILTGVLILRLKEVTPEKIPQKFSNFWRKDIKAHRMYYQTCKKEDNQKLINELQAMGIAKRPSDGLEGTFLQSLFERATHDSDLINIKDWVSLPPSTQPPSSNNLPRFDLKEDQEELLSPNSNTTLSYLDHNSTVQCVPLKKHSLDSYHYQPYATFHAPCVQRHPFNSFLNVPNFFQSELRKSTEFRRREYTGDDRKPANV